LVGEGGPSRGWGGNGESGGGGEKKKGKTGLRRIAVVLEL
jgi:hypothetical protein